MGPADRERRWRLNAANRAGNHAINGDFLGFPLQFKVPKVIRQGLSGRREQTPCTDQDNAIVFADVEEENKKTGTAIFSLTRRKRLHIA